MKRKRADITGSHSRRENLDEGEARRARRAEGGSLTSGDRWRGRPPASAADG